MTTRDDLERMYREMKRTLSAGGAKTPQEWLDECARRFSEAVGVEVRIDDLGNFVPVESGVVLDYSLFEMQTVKEIKTLVDSVRREAGMMRENEGSNK